MESTRFAVASGTILSRTMRINSGPRQSLRTPRALSPASAAVVQCAYCVGAATQRAEADKYLQSNRLVCCVLFRVSQEACVARAPLGASTNQGPWQAWGIYAE